MKYDIMLELGASALLLVALICMRLRKSVAGKSNRNYFIYMCSLWVTAMLDMGKALLLNRGAAIPAVVDYVVLDLFFMSHTLMGYFLLRYTIEMLPEDDTSVRIHRIIGMVGILAEALMLIISNSAGWFFRFSKGVYEETSAFFVLYLIGALFLYDALIIMISKKQFFTRQQTLTAAVCVISSALIPVAMVLLKTPVLFTYFVLILGSFGLLFTLDTPEYFMLLTAREELQAARSQAEVDRETALRAKTEAENARASAELEAAVADAARLLAEEARDQAEGARLEAEQASGAKSKFLANMSHEIRTPINGILGMNELLLAELTDPALREYALNIQSASKSLLALVNDTLDLSKIERGKMELVETVYSLSVLIRDCFGLVEHQAVEKGLSLVVENDPELPDKLYGDEVRVRQIISNLLTNAVKYTKEGSVTLRVNGSEPIGSKMRLRVSVIDTGIGISPENQTMLFRAFQRLDEINTKDIEGTGLGLQITSQLLEMMGGTIELTSEYGKGSEFYVEIPQRIEEAKPIGDLSSLSLVRRAVTKTVEEKTEGSENRDGKKAAALGDCEFTAPGKTVLVVDDVAVNRKVVLGLLKNTQMELESASGGEQAVEMALQKKYDLILMDHMMPGTDGVEALRLIRQKRGGINENTPIVVLTANAVVGAREEYMLAGFSDYLTKPIRKAELFRCLHEQLDEAKTAEEQTDAESEGGGADWIADLERYIDVQAGLIQCGMNEELYRSVLFGYLSDGQYDGLCKAFEEKDWKNYRIRIHGVRNTALKIGAETLSERARQLEEAMTKNRTEYVEQNHETFMSYYAELLEYVRQGVASVDKNGTELSNDN